MPIDRQHALALRLNGGEGIVHADPTEAERINSLVAASAHRWIFQHPEDPSFDVSNLPEPHKWSIETLGVIVEEKKIRIQKQLIRRQARRH